MPIFQSPPPSGGRLGGGHSADGVPLSFLGILGFPPPRLPPLGGGTNLGRLFSGGLPVKKTSPLRGEGPVWPSSKFLGQLREMRHNQVRWVGPVAKRAPSSVDKAGRHAKCF